MASTTVRRPWTGLSDGVQQNLNGLARRLLRRQRKKKLASQGALAIHLFLDRFLGPPTQASRTDGAGLSPKETGGLGRGGNLQVRSGVAHYVSQSELKLPVGWSEAADDLGCGCHGPTCRVYFSIPAPRIHFFMRPILDITRSGRIPLFFLCNLALLGLVLFYSELGKLEEGRGGG